MLNAFYWLIQKNCEGYRYDAFSIYQLTIWLHFAPQWPILNPSLSFSRIVLVTTIVIAADSLYKKDLFCMFDLAIDLVVFSTNANVTFNLYTHIYAALPDPFAVLTIDGDQTHTTTVMKKTLNPYWNESFDV